MSENPIARNAIASLKQAADLIGGLSDTDYSEPENAVFGYSVGSHFRHLYEHYVLFRRGWASGMINFDARDRDPRFERDRAYALDCIRDMCEWLEHLPATEANRAIQVAMDCGDGPTADNRSGTTVKRELQNLVMHDVHHYAIIAMMLKARNAVLPPGFGVAPSTRAYHLN
ncbi:MAG: hypothetical protein RRC34_05460 [Lentisphaeria bacterium]|nr:hypothetical protein [Lentisphaeria bacterium]